MKEIGEAFVRLARATHGVKGSAILLNAGADLRDIAEQLLKERDSALAGMKAAELRAEAYREVAINYACLDEYGVRKNADRVQSPVVDAEAARIMKENGNAMKISAAPNDQQHP